MAADGGIRFGQYVLLRRIARGGMAEVFLAQQQGLEGFDRRVAVKRILPHLADSPDFVKMFLGEAKLAAQLSHPNVVHIYDFGKVDNDYFIAMEFVDGVHAGQLFKYGERERLSPTLVARVGADSATALHYAHELRTQSGKPLTLVHRDVSPANLMVSYDGVVKLCDFGIAKAAAMSDQLTNPGQVKGKYAYMSPEQTVAAPLDGRSDVFSLCVVLWELLAGKTIVPRGDAVEAMRAIRDGRLPSLATVAPDVPRQLVDAIEWGLQTKRERRATASELAQALEAFIKVSPDLATPLQLGQWLRVRFPREVTGSHQAVSTHAKLSSAGTGAHGTLAAPETGEHATREEDSEDSIDPPHAGDGTAISEGGTMGEPGTSLTHAIGAVTSEPEFDSATILEPHKRDFAERIARGPNDTPETRGTAAITGRLPRRVPTPPAAEPPGAAADDDLAETHDQRDTAADDDSSAFQEVNDTTVRRPERGPLPGSGGPLRPMPAPLPPASRASRPPGAPQLPRASSTAMPGHAAVSASGPRLLPEPRSSQLGFHGGGSSAPFQHASPSEDTVIQPSAMRASQHALAPVGFDPHPSHAPYPDTALGTLHVRARPVPRRFKVIAALAGVAVLSFLVALATTQSSSRPVVQAGSAARGAATPDASAGPVVVVGGPAGSGVDGEPGEAGEAGDASLREPTITTELDAGARPSLVTVNTQPAGGIVTIGTEGARRAPAQFALVPGLYVVTAELEGFPPVKLQLQVSPVDSTFEVVFTKRAGDPGSTGRTPTAAAAATGKLTVRTNPYSEVYLGTDKLGETPFAELTVPAGKLTLIFKNPSHPTVRRTVEILPGKTAKLLFDLP